MKAFMSPRDPFCHNSHKQWLNDQSVFTESSLLNQNLSQGERGLPYSLSSRLQQAKTAQDKTTLREDVNMVLKWNEKPTANLKHPYPHIMINNLRGLLLLIHAAQILWRLQNVKERIYGHCASSFVCILIPSGPWKEPVADLISSLFVDFFSEQELLIGDVTAISKNAR